jgi:hypothetical protein
MACVQIRTCTLALIIIAFKTAGKNLNLQKTAKHVIYRLRSVRTKKYFPSAAEASLGPLLRPRENIYSVRTSHAAGK